MGSLLGSTILLLAEAGDAKGGGAAQWISLWPIAAILFLFYFLFIRPQRSEASRREAMIQALKPNDHVMTHGGIYGVVVNVHRDANAVTIRVDENTNTKLKVSLAAIGRVLSEDGGAETPPKKE